MNCDAHCRTSRVLACLNVTQMVLNIREALQVDGAGFLTFLTEPLTAILVDAFLSDLHKAAAANTHQESLSSMGSLEFRVVGSIAATLSGSNQGVEAEEGMADGEDGEDGNMEIEEVPRTPMTGSSPA
ncbi:hypothetical protein PYCCODRAFT_1435973 [Trametes coccinea BRFM310]|uniref:Uncharacterized protein n=1 Tax=Trametes coccinea (strain BRFM310) TaxID=1353009 RepID=A0A1Y2IP13_TRAC3|nr:hypothetical protein PYCCODRAFT_1435973 [Trametes coccinea BRFM310]